MLSRVSKEASREKSSSEFHCHKLLIRPQKRTNNQQVNMDEKNKVNIECAAHKPKRGWLRNPKNPNFTAPTSGLDIVHLKFISNQDAARLVETNDKLAKYSAFLTKKRYKHGKIHR